MNSFLTIVRSNMLAQGIVFVLLGLFIVLAPDKAITTLVYLLGAFFGISGAVSLIGYNRERSDSYHSAAVLTSGVFMVVLALVVFIFPHAVASFSTLIIGVVLTLCGVVSAVRSLELKKLGGYVWVSGLVVGALVAIGGILIIVNPFDTAVMFCYVLGAVMIVNGACDLYLEIQDRRLLKTN